MTLQFEFLKSINVKNKRLNDFIKRYSYYVISPELTEDIKNKISKNFEQSNFLMINYFDEHFDELEKCKGNGYFIICFKFTIIIVMQSYLNNLTDFFSTKQNLDIYFLSKAKDMFNLNLNISYKVRDFSEILNISNFDMTNFNNNLKSKNKNKIWDRYIAPCISEYLFMASYQNNKDRLFDFFSNQNQLAKQNVVNDDEYIDDLGIVGNSQSFSVVLIYHIEKQLLLVIKKPFGSEHVDMIENEKNNYTKNQLLFPLLPIFYGTTSNGYIITEYIKGKSLEKIKELNLSDDDKFQIIVKLIFTIFYLHSKCLIYTDLKPNNIIIDDFKNPVLIDFDIMIKFGDENYSLRSRNFELGYLPKNDEELCYETDIYSLGKLIYFIMSGKHPEENVKIEDFGKHPELFEIYLNCTNENYKFRPNLISCVF